MGFDKLTKRIHCTVNPLIFNALKLFDSKSFCSVGCNFKVSPDELYTCSSIAPRI